MASQGLHNINYLKRRFILKEIISYAAEDELSRSARNNLPIYIKFARKTRNIWC